MANTRHVAIALALLVVAGCNARRHVPASATPQSGGGTISGTITTISRDSFERLIAHMPPPSPEELAFRRRVDSLDALVDSIVVVSPDSIVLHVGQVFDDRLVREGAFRRTGEQLPTYSGNREIDDRSVAEFTDAGIVGRQVGRTHLVLSIAGH